MTSKLLCDHSVVAVTPTCSGMARGCAEFTVTTETITVQSDKCNQKKAEGGTASFPEEPSS